jgi:hypothetical protein
VPKSLRRRICTLLALMATAVAPVAVDLPDPAQAATGDAAGGYWMVAADGGVFSFGHAPFWGSTGNVRLNRPIVGMAPTPGSGAKGYWMVAADGGIFSFGNARFFGSTGDVKLNKPIVGMAPTPSGKGYWLVASDGGMFSFGDAGFFGSTGDVKLNKPIVGMAPTRSGKGYWLVASDGGMFNFGDATFYGSGGATGKTFAGMATTASGRGYWLGSTSGEVLAFGDARQLGSAAPALPVVGMAGTPSGGGYWLTTSGGHVYSFGDAPNYGSTAGIQLNQPMVGFSAAAAAVPDTTTTTAAGPTTTTAPPDTGPEKFPPQEAPTGNSEPTPAGPNSCGFPSAPKTASFADNNHIGSGSGLAASTKYPGVHWVIRDGGVGRASLYAVRFDSDGMPTSKDIPVWGAQNSDWEEVTYSVGADGRGRLWIVDSGDRGVPIIYEVLEPNPDTATTAEVLGEYMYALPSGHAYTIEAAFMHRGYLVLVGKRPSKAPVYIFDKLVAGQTNVPSYLGTLGNSSSVSTARVSPDGKILVTASRTTLHLYRSTDGSGSLRSFIGRMPDCESEMFPSDSRVESGEWLSDTSMLFLDENKKSLRLAVKP